MKILKMLKPGEMVIEDVSPEDIKPEHARIKMEYCGICGSDLTAYMGKNPTVKFPILGIGHEGVGQILEIENYPGGLKAGDRVAIEPYTPCLKCHSCKEERFNNCVDIRVAGVHSPGVMAEEIIFPSRQLYKLPDSLSSLEASLVEPLTIGLHAAYRARVQAGDIVVITGAGPIGLLAALGVKSMGAIPILVDIVKDRLNLAVECGIEHVFDSSVETDNLIDYLRNIAGILPNAMIECTGAPAIIANMHDYVRHGGRIALVGWPKGPVTVNTVRCLQKELDILPSRNSNKQFPHAIDIIASVNFPSEKIITKVITLAETETVMNDMIANPGNYVKVIVEI